MNFLSIQEVQEIVSSPAEKLLQAETSVLA